MVIAMDQEHLADVTVHIDRTQRSALAVVALATQHLQVAFVVDKRRQVGAVPLPDGERDDVIDIK